MSGKSVIPMRFAALALTCAGAAVAAMPAPADAQSYFGGYAESAADALARNLKILATSPKDFNALIAAGKAALALGDNQAAAGFFGRAEEVWPANPQPQIGMGAALAHEGDASAALQYFARAVQLGAAPLMVGAQRGLAYDLLGQHAQAQADYRSALGGPDVDEARRRLALSLAIGGNKDEALSVLGPLMAKGDAAGARARAFVLALTGDSAGARAAIEAAMPGSSFRMDYFFQRLPTLASQQKAAAVHLGIFPNANSQIAAPVYSQPPQSAATAPLPGLTGDRLASIDRLLTQGAPSASSQPLTPRAAPAPAQPGVRSAAPVEPTQQTQVASARRTVVPATGPGGSGTGSAEADSGSKRYWLQLASGGNPEALPAQFRRIASRNRDVFAGLDGYVVEDAGKARLLIGPFKDAADARTFANDLESISVRAFPWTSLPRHRIRKLPSE